jgi:hypothetical protein
MSAVHKPKSELALLPADLPLPSTNPISVTWMEKDLAASGLTTQDIHVYPIEPVGWTCGAYVMWSPIPRLDRGPSGAFLAACILEGVKFEVKPDYPNAVPYIKHGE